MTFTGIPAEAFDFYDALAADNSKAFWIEHRQDYETDVRGPMSELADAVEPHFGHGHLFRPYRDVRFSKDKTPYKDHQGLYIEHRNGVGWYVQLNRSGLMAGGGWHDSTSGQVAAYREAVGGDDAGRLQALLDRATAAGLAIDGQQLKTRPRGVDPDHPRLHLLRYRSLVLSRSWEPAAWMGTPSALDEITGVWETMRPVLGWIADAVGPAEATDRPGRASRSR